MEIWKMFWEIQQQVEQFKDEAESRNNEYAYKYLDEVSLALCEALNQMEGGIM